MPGVSNRDRNVICVDAHNSALAHVPLNRVTLLEDESKGPGRRLSPAYPTGTNGRQGPKA